MTEAIKKLFFYEKKALSAIFGFSDISNTDDMLYVSFVALFNTGVLVGAVAVAFIWALSTLSVSSLLWFFVICLANYFHNHAAAAWIEDMSKLTKESGNE